MRNQQSKAEKSNAAKILSETKPDSRILAVFGPEGGLSREEVDYFVEHKGYFVVRIQDPFVQKQHLFIY